MRGVLDDDMIERPESRHRLRHHRINPFSSESYFQESGKKFRKHRRSSLLIKNPFRDTKFNVSKPARKVTCSEEPRKINGTEEEVCPTFATRIANITQAVGRNVQMECVVDNLGRFRVAWMRVETKAILTLHMRKISRNVRISLSHSDHRIFILVIRNVQVSDRGSYMCQVNTHPFMSQTVYLDVVVPPDIVEEETSSDLYAREGADVTLKCSARGHPPPMYSWRREDKKPVVSGNWQDSHLAHVVQMTEDESPAKDAQIIHQGPELTIQKVSRLHMAAYLCIASNGVLPSVSRRIQLQVQFQPMIWIPHQLVGARLGANVTVECNTEAHPESINYWSRHEGQMIVNDGRFGVLLNVSDYKKNMVLTVAHLEHADYGTYKCFARNSLGSTEGIIRIYQVHGSQPEKEPSSAKIHNSYTTLEQRGTDSQADEKMMQSIKGAKHPVSPLEVSDVSDSTCMIRNPWLLTVVSCVFIVISSSRVLLPGT
ncbi:hypothetical protein JTE90_024201 [Oedothorax gibbosus]|uniref:Ig-like domain-containing protein n=1 Tax=Oedothorax gibbosus TaxID=931172 RepID=A0AAV6U195_9ARAC|nr:hypothetical protein JTE90_024201 [Oedothorax gibbosus]